MKKFEIPAKRGARARRLHWYSRTCKASWRPGAPARQSFHSFRGPGGRPCSERDCPLDKVIRPVFYSRPFMERLHYSGARRSHNRAPRMGCQPATSNGADVETVGFEAISRWLSAPTAHDTTGERTNSQRTPDGVPDCDPDGVDVVFTSYRGYRGGRRRSTPG